MRLVLVTLDTLRYDALVPPSGGESPMPRLLARSRDGALFERFYSATSITQPSHASMLTGLHPWEHGVVGNGQVLDGRFETVAEVLREAGFATAAVVASFPVASRFGFGQGFDSFDERFTEHPVADRRWEGHDVPEDRFYSLADTVTDRALALLGEGAGAEARDGRPRDRFLWVHYFDPHDPYGDTGGGRRYHATSTHTLIEKGRDVEPWLRRLRRAYDRDAGFLDRQLDRLLAALEPGGGAYDTHVVLASDHGESFGEEGALVHGMRLTEEQIRVPLVILSPRVAPGRRRDVAGSVDVARTLLSLAGVEAPAGWAGRGGSAGRLGPWARDLTATPGQDRDRDPLRGGALGMRRTFPAGRTELRTDGTRHPVDGLRFYAVDPEGRRFLGDGAALTEETPAPGPATARRLTALFRALEKSVEAGAAPAAADEEALEALRALGYVD